MPSLALISLARLAAISLATTFCAAPPFSRGDKATQRSSRDEAACSIASCVSESLMDMTLTLRVFEGPANPAPH